MLQKAILWPCPDFGSDPLAPRDVFQSKGDGSTLLVLEYVGRKNLLAELEERPDRFSNHFIIK